MKIAIVSSNEQVAPPPDNVIIASLYMSSILAEELVRKGHDVYSIVGKGSAIKTKKAFSLSKPFFEVISKDEWENLGDLRLMWQLIAPFEMDLNLTLLDFLKTQKVDIVNFHSTLPYYGLPFALRTGLPCVFTLHSTVNPLELRVIKTFLDKNIHFVSISNYQRKGYPEISFRSTVYHGIRLEDFKFSLNGGESMVIASRFKRIKGIEFAIKVARITAKKLLIAGEVRVSENEYFYNTIQPLIEENSSLVHLLNFMNHSMIDGFFRKGKLFLFPIQWEEPFGLVMIESMATGTPVVAFARGSVPEVIKDGETGFIVNSSPDDIRGNWIIKKTGIEGLSEAVEHIYSMPEEKYRTMRRACRAHVEKNFTVERMVDEYEKVYRKILSGNPIGHNDILI